MLWDLEAAFLEVIRGLPPGRSPRGLPGWQGANLLGVESSPRFQVYLESGMWRGYSGYVVQWRKKGIPIESWQTFLE